MPEESRQEIAWRIAAQMVADLNAVLQPSPRLREGCITLGDGKELHVDFTRIRNRSVAIILNQIIDDYDLDSLPGDDELMMFRERVESGQFRRDVEKKRDKPPPITSPEIRAIGDRFVLEMEIYRNEDRAASLDPNAAKKKDELQSTLGKIIDRLGLEKQDQGHDYVLIDGDEHQVFIWINAILPEGKSAEFDRVMGFMGEGGGNFSYASDASNGLTYIGHNVLHTLHENIVQGPRAFEEDLRTALEIDMGGPNLP